MTTVQRTTRNLKIEGMTNDGDVAKVTGVLKNVGGLSNHTVKIGSASIEADQTGCDAACKAISGAGFKTHERTAKPDNNAKQSGKTH